MSSSPATSHFANKIVTLCQVGPSGDPRCESYSPFCLKVARALNLAGIAFASRIGARPSSFRSLNATGQVPVLLVDGTAIADSTAILDFIESASQGTECAAVYRRAQARILEEMADSVLNSYLVAARWADDANWPKLHDAFFGKTPWFVRHVIAPRIRSSTIQSLIARDVWRAGPEACWSRFRATLDDLETCAPVRGYWLDAEEVTRGDLGIFAQLQSLRNKLTPGQAQEIEKRKTLSAYLDRVDGATRPREHVIEGKSGA